MTEESPKPAAPAQPHPPAEPIPPVPSVPPSPAATPPPAARGASPVAWIVALALAAMVGALLFVGGYLAAGARGAGRCEAPTQAFEALCEAYDKLKVQFVDDLDDELLAEGAIRGMFEYGVRDPFSGYMSPDDYQRALGTLSGEFSGIGAEMGVRNLEDPDDLESCTTFSDACALVVIAPLDDSPAERAGLQAGDVVVAIDGESVNGLDLGDAVSRIRGEEGTDVTLGLRRDGGALDLRITRARIQTREVVSEMLDDGIAYVRLNNFSNPGADQFRDAVRGLVEQGATGIVFDLRDNPGGYIEAARQIASQFIAEGLVFTQESAGDEVKRWEATGDGAAVDPELEVVVLVNGGSASASEIVAAALQERERATIVGQPTYGKNTVQLWDPLENGGGVRITISRWFTPEHHSVAPDGVQPDVTVEIPDGTPPERDLFLEKALEILTGRVVGDDGVDQPEPTSWTDGTDASPSAAEPAPWLFSWDPTGLAAAVT